VHAVQVDAPCGVEHEEARGIDVAVRALLAAAADDHQVLAQGMTLFEGLYVNTSGKR